MRTLTLLSTLTLISLLGACGGSSSTKTDAAVSGDGPPIQADAAVTGDAPHQVDGAAQSDAPTSSEAAAQSDGGGPGANGIGASCTCTGSTCAQMGVPLPAGGTITGCENVPTNDPGAALVCLRTYTGTLANKTYFANGYCSLMATSCTGASLICGSAVFGDYATMSTCPAGSVLIEQVQTVTITGLGSATVSSKQCARGCTGAGTCREGELDPADSNTASQYQCIDKGGVKFCLDPRDLAATYTATAF